jgi:hypothetical protein
MATMTLPSVRTPTAAHDRKLGAFFSLPVRTSFLVGVIFGVLVWELWQAATGWGEHILAALANSVC